MRHVAVFIVLVAGTLVAYGRSPAGRQKPPGVVAGDDDHANKDVSPCCGAERASLGSLFNGLKLGETTLSSLPNADRLGPDIEFELEIPRQRVDGIVIKISDTVRKPPLCPVLRDQLTKAWGPMTGVTADRWESPSRDRAVDFVASSPDGCSLHFYRLVPPRQWLNTSRRSVVPIWAIGRPIADLKAVLAPLEPDERDPAYSPPSIEWHDTAISGAEIVLTAYYAKGKVIGIAVLMEYDQDLQAWRRLNAVFGAPGRADVHDESLKWKWNRTPGIVLDNAVPDLPSASAHRTRASTTKPNAYTSTSIVFGVEPASP